jgi:hypothetical protein
MHAIERTSRRGRAVVHFVYSNWRVNGACTNKLSLPVSTLDETALATLKADVLTPEIVEAVVTRTIELARLEPDEHAECRQRLTSEAERLAGVITNHTTASGRRAASSRRSWRRYGLVSVNAPTCWRDSSTSTA